MHTTHKWEWKNARKQLNSMRLCVFSSSVVLYRLMRSIYWQLARPSFLVICRGVSIVQVLSYSIYQFYAHKFRGWFDAHDTLMWFHIHAALEPCNLYLNFGQATKDLTRNRNAYTKRIESESTVYWFSESQIPMLSVTTFRKSIDYTITFFRRFDDVSNVDMANPMLSWRW